MESPETSAFGSKSQRPPPKGCALVGVALIVVAFLAIGAAGPYTNWLWYLHDVQKPQVFTTAYATKGLLFSLAFLLSVGLFWWSLTRALGVTLVYLRVPETLGEALVSNVLGWLQRNGAGAAKLAALVLGFLFASGFSNEWQTYLLAREGQLFGVNDPIFGRDIGFFVFTVPWLLAVVNALCTLLLLNALAAFGIYFGLQTLAQMAKIELSGRAVRSHLCGLFGCAALAYAWQVWLRRYEFGLVDSGLFTGAGAAASHKLAVQTFLAFLLGAVGVAILLNARLWKPYRVAFYGIGTAAAVWVLGMLVWPSLYQRVWVEPDKLAMEGPYAKRAIDMTRWAFGLSDIEARDVNVQDAPTNAELQAALPTLASMRLWDPDILRRSVDVLQGLRPYYRFNDVDVDRYVIAGKPRQVMLSARDIRLDGLSANARSWINTRLQYTHGYGVALAAVNESTPSGQPVFIVRDVPPSGPGELAIRQPRIYFGDARNLLGEPTDEYALVHTGVAEFDYPSEQGEKTYRWTGRRGIPIGGLLPKMAFGLAFGDGNLVVSGNITGQTKLLWRRNVLERARLCYPFLKLDNDPYVVIHDGRLVWILDAYTATGQIPYSAREFAVRGEPLNYIRNSVKVTIDAYSGEVNAYALLPNEPVLSAYRRVYPGLIRDWQQFPAGLVPHLRYPEDMFYLQSAHLTQYHVSDPTIFINNSDAWELPAEIGASGSRELMKPYYVHMQLPGDSQPRFILILPFTPREKPNMSGWLAAHCDPDQYGRLLLFKFPKGSNMPGPSQMDANFNQDSDVANVNKLLNTDQSVLEPGNLIVVPVGQSVLYVKPLFLRSSTPGIPAPPELKKVLLGLRGDVVIADTYAEGLQKLFGGAQAPPDRGEPPPARAGPPGATGPTAADDVKSGIRESARLLREADAALRAGDFAKYGELQKRLKKKLEELGQ